MMHSICRKLAALLEGLSMFARTATMLVGTLSAGAIAQTTAPTLAPIPFQQSHNFLLGSLHTPYPSGVNTMLGGVRFDIPKNVPQNMWLSDPTMTLTGEITLEIPVTGVFDVDRVHFLANTILGRPFTPQARIEFISFPVTANRGGVDETLPGVIYCKNLVGNVDIRAYLASDGLHTDTITALTTTQVYLSSNQQNRLDKIDIDLPTRFNGRSLDLIRVVDLGGPFDSRIFIAGITAQLGTENSLAEPPCNPADLNRADAFSPTSPGFGNPDALITPADFIAFVHYFTTGDLRADLNTASAFSPASPGFGAPDGMLTPADFVAFQFFFTQGCMADPDCFYSED